MLLGLASGATAQTADTELRIPGAPVVNGATCTGPLSMPVPAAGLGRNPGNTHSAELALAAPLSAGTYIVSAGSSDPSHPTATNQPNEIWTAVFWSATNVKVGQPKPPRIWPLPTLRRPGHWPIWYLPARPPGWSTSTPPRAVSVQYVHANVPHADLGAQNFDSIEPLCLGLTAPVYPPAPPVEQPAPAVVPPAPEVIVDPKPGPTPDPEKIVELPKAEAIKVVSNPRANAVNLVVEAARVAVVPVVTVVTVASVTTVAPVPAPVVEPAVVKVAGIQVIATPENGTQVLGAVSERPVAFTGANSIPMALAGMAQFGIGAVLLIGARRRAPRARARLR